MEPWHLVEYDNGWVGMQPTSEKVEDRPCPAAWILYERKSNVVVSEWRSVAGRMYQEVGWDLQKIIMAAFGTAIVMARSLAVIQEEVRYLKPDQTGAAYLLRRAP